VILLQNTSGIMSSKLLSLTESDFKIYYSDFICNTCMSGRQALS